MRVKRIIILQQQLLNQTQDEEVARKLTNLTKDITPVDDKSDELRSLILGLGIPSVILSILAFL